jgi:hypothetical protein
MSIDHVGDQSVYADFLAVCGFSFIGLLLSVRMLLELGPMAEMTFLY